MSKSDAPSKERQVSLTHFIDKGVSECPTCDDTFDTRLGVKMHHAKVHGESISNVDIECGHCGCTFTVKESRKDTAKYCSRECKDDWQSENLTGPQAHTWNGGDVEFDCEVCGKTESRNKAEVEKYERNFCSVECMGKWREDNIFGENHHQYTKRECECEWCGETFLSKEYRADERRFCSTECTGKWLSTIFGQDHPSYKHSGGVRKVIRRIMGAKSWSAISKEVRKEYGECYMCGKDKPDTGEALHVHHIAPIYAGGTNEKWNLMPLCRQCHASIEAYTRDIFNIHLKPD